MSRLGRSRCWPPIPNSSARLARLLVEPYRSLATRKSSHVSWQLLPAWRPIPLLARSLSPRRHRVFKFSVDHRGARLAVTEQLKRWEKANIPSQDSRAQLSVANTSSDQLYPMSDLDKSFIEKRPLFLFMKMLGAVFSLHQNQETQH